MELWFTERFRDNVELSLRVSEKLYDKRSLYQDVVIVETLAYGRMLILDGCVMTTEKDEFVYHEMISHPAMLAHPNPKQVCVVGGGDGGTVREVLKHASVERVVLAEIDEDVITSCKKFMPSLAGCLDDPRVEIRVGDGIKYLGEQSDAFDVVLSDSTDPIGPGVVLFEDAYFANAKKALKAGGVFVTQCESVWTNPSALKEFSERMKRYFKIVLPYNASIPTYPSGTWNFIFGSDNLDPRAHFSAERQKKLSSETRYYTPEHQIAAFAIPAFAKR